MDKKVYIAVKSGRMDHSIMFADFEKLVVDLGFALRRKKGSHRIFKHAELKESMNIQPDGKMAKSYQVEQLRDIIIEHGL